MDAEETVEQLTVRLCSEAYDMGGRDAADKFMLQILSPRKDGEKYSKEEIEYAIEWFEKAIIKLKKEYDIK